MTPSNRHLRRYTLLGAAFGVMFPVVATVVQAWLGPDGLTLAGVATAQSMPLLWIIDTAPLFLGGFAGMAGTRQDQLELAMGELERTNQALAEKNRALGEANEGLLATSKLKSQFLANMSHELRTPLNAIIGFSRILLKKTKDLIPERQIKNLTMVNESGHHLLALVNDILDIEGIEAGMTHVVAAPTQLNALVHDVVDRLAPAADAKGLTVSAAVPTHEITLHTDVVRLRQVLDNLVNNAIKYSDSGAITVRVEARPEADPGAVLIHVEDEGIGIPPDMIGKVFDPFQQVDGSTTRAQGGVGLGLHLVSKILGLLNGSVTAESEVGRGSTFTVKLPLLQSSAEAAVNAGEIDLAPQGHGPTVLLIDDTASMIEVMRSELVDAGFRVYAAIDGETGLTLAAEIQPSVVLLDIVMPGMDGWTVLKALKGSPELAKIPVVITSQLDNNPNASELGIAAWLTKPVCPETFRDVLGRVGLVAADDVLVVEDDAAIASMVVQHLDELSLSSRTSRDGAQAIEALSSRLPGAVVLDLMLPKLDGFAVLEHLRGMEAGANVPVIVYTARDLTRHERERLQAGPVEIIGKGALDGIQSLVSRLSTVAAGGAR